MIRAISNTRQIGLSRNRTARRWAACVVFVLVPMIGPAAAGSDEEVRGTFDRFVAAQNAHDIAAVESLLVVSPEFLWITRGAPVWGADAALERFASLYEGTWQLEPEASGLKVIMIGEGAAQVFIPINFTIGAPGEEPKQTRFLMNMVLAKAAGGWKISSILPIPAPAQ